MSKFSRVVVLVVGLMSVFAAMAGAAGAATWGNSAGTTFTATAGASTLSTTSATLSCNSSGATGSTGASTTNATWTGAASGSVNWGFAPAPAGSACLIGGTNYTVSCSYSLNATSHSPVTDPSPGTDGATTTGSVVVNCTVNLGTSGTGIQACTITGTISGGVYTNGTSGGAGRLTVPAVTAASGALRVGQAGCPLGNGVSGAFTGLVYTTTSATPPKLYHG